MTKKTGGNETHSEWPLIVGPDGFRLEHYSDGHAAFFPGQSDLAIGKGANLTKPLIIIGEEGAGETTLIRSINETNGMTTQLVDFESFDGTTSSELLAFVFQTKSVATLAERVRILAQKTRLVMHGIDRMLPAQLPLGTKFLAQLRRLYDVGDPANRLQVILLARNETAVDTEPYSAIVSVSNLCRLPRFDDKELVQLLKLLKVSGVSAQELSQITGGQPLLTRMLLEKLPQLVDLNRARAAIRDYPPAALRPWRERLARMVIVQPALKTHAKFLAEGGEYAVGLGAKGQPAPYVTRALSLAGWMSPSIGQDGETVVWRFSELHRHWAAPVLREPRKFLPSGQRRGGES